jgi:hypothetical protein
VALKPPEDGAAGCGGDCGSACWAEAEADAPTRIEIAAQVAQARARRKDDGFVESMVRDRWLDGVPMTVNVFFMGLSQSRSR